MLERALSLTTLALLLVAMVVGLGPNTSTRVVQLGESIWPGYAAELREPSQAPTCDPEELKQQLATCVPVAPAPEPEDPFAEEEDPFAEPAPSPEPDPFAEPAPDPEADPFAEAPEPTPRVNCAALETLVDRCDARWADHQRAVSARTSTVAAFARLDGAVSAVAKFPYGKHLLVLLVLFGGLATTLHRAHLALRDPQHVHEHRLAHGASLVAWALWGVSCFFDWRVQEASSAESANGALPILWMTGFGLLALVELVHLLRPPRLDGDFHPVRALASVPLFAWMVGIGGLWFLLGEGHSSGQAIFLHKFVQIPSIYLGIGLYIWAGMLLSKTRLARQVFDVLDPWKLPPTWLAWLVVVLAAIPTAYSGASGIFVIAAGAVIFERLVAAGAPPRIAMAATAMSGSLGVVLRPCLVVVLVAVLNTDVTTDQLFGWGRLVFALTAGLFGLAMLWRNDTPWQRPALREASAGSMRAFSSLLPTLGLGVVVFGLYWIAMGSSLSLGEVSGGPAFLYRAAWMLFESVVTEHTAALVLPGMMLALVVFDRWRAGEAVVSGLATATAEASHHIGALLFVMAGSVGIGGVVERSEVMGLLPADLGGPWPAMAVLVVVMVLVGMTMDALGAVILVSVSLTHVAAANDIHPVHFWMMVLCAFELGYLTPPVALNHLLARQVIGEDALVENLPASGLAERYEHIWLPMVVMGAALLIVAFGPLLVG